MRTPVHLDLCELSTTALISNPPRKKARREDNLSSSLCTFGFDRALQSSSLSVCFAVFCQYQSIQSQLKVVQICMSQKLHCSVEQIIKSINVGSYRKESTPNKYHLNLKFLTHAEFVLYLSRKRPEGLIVLLVESSGIASLFLPSGRTTHSRFEIPLAVDECSHMSY